jgi:hypothetical protein
MIVALSLLILPAAGVSAAQDVMTVTGSYVPATGEPDDQWWSADKGNGDAGSDLVPPTERTVRHDIGSGGTFTGGIEGTTVANVRIVYAPNGNNGNQYWMYVVGNGTFSGTIDGKEGTCQIHFNVEWAGPPVPTGELTGTFKLSNGTGELAGIHGKGIFGGILFDQTVTLEIWFN